MPSTWHEPTVVIRDTALRSLARLRSDDKNLFIRARHAITQLAGQPRPADAVPWGGTGIYRLRADSIRILYEVDEAAATIFIINVATTR
jgi:mRNA-degrading endonuclease RelE of RelBE toxin-antitoxin system